MLDHDHSGLWRALAFVKRHLVIGGAVILLCCLAVVFPEGSYKGYIAGPGIACATGGQVGQSGSAIAKAEQAKELIEVALEPTAKRIVLSGWLVPDEASTTRIHPRFAGTVERVFADLQGKKVKKGQPLLSIESPDFVSIQQELLRAKQAKDALAGCGFEEIGQGCMGLYLATRERLRLFEISEQQMRRIEERGAPERAFIVESPADGFVVAANAAKGLKVTPELELYTITDLTTIWMLAEIAGQDLPMVQVGQSASIALDSFPGATFPGKVTFIYPESGAAAHTTVIRLECPNRDLKLKPGMEARGEIKKDLGMKIAVPASAVLESENGQIVFVAADGDRIESRKVNTGIRIDDRVVIESGLEPGEKIVASAEAASSK